MLNFTPVTLPRLMFGVSDLAHIINAVPEPIFVKDQQHRWVLLNCVCCSLMSVTCEEVIGKSDGDFFPEAEAEVFRAREELVFETGREDVNDEILTDRKGYTHSITTTRRLYVSGAGERFIVGSIRQLEQARGRLERQGQSHTAELTAANEALRIQIAETERNANERRQSQKMEAIGRLAGGVAHDFNNLLNVIIGYSSLLQNQLPADGTLHEQARQVLIAAEKAASLTRQLLAFSRKQVLQPEILNLNDVLADMAKMLDALTGEDVELRILPGLNLGYTRADRGQIEQIMMNLAVNARDAMPMGGTLTIETRNVPRLDDSQEHGTDQRSGILLTVRDTGKGMDPETMVHIFEPFFTTKAPGKGTGLGLATVYGIVRQSGGYIQVNSRVGEGTTVKICLPRAAEAPPSFNHLQPAAETMQGAGTILLAEDQESLRRLFGEVLRGNGYTVLEADSGKSAIEIAGQHRGRIDLLLTDVVMPGMRGWELASHLSILRPEMKVLYMSGHTDTDLLKEGALANQSTLLQKPFKMDVLLLKVRDLLRSDNTGGDIKAA